MRPANEVKVHGIILDPYNRVGVVHTRFSRYSHASLTRLSYNGSPESVLKRAFLQLFEARRIDYSVTPITLATGITIEEVKYELFILYLYAGFVLKHSADVSLKFVPASKIPEEDGDLHPDTRAILFKYIKQSRHPLLTPIFG